MEQVVPGSADNAMGDAAQVQSLARKLSAEDAQLFYQTALIGRKDLAVTPDARMGFEMTLLRMLAFRPGADRREPPALGSGSSNTGGHSEPEPEPGPAPQPEPIPEPIPEPEPPAPPSAPEPVPSSTPEPVAGTPEPPVAPEPVPEALAEPEQQAVAPAEPDVSVQEPAVAEQPEFAESEPGSTGDFVWERDFRELGITGMPGNLASNCAMAMDGNTVVLTVDEGHARLLNARHEEKILAALRSRFGDTTELRIEQGNPGPQTPAAYAERQRAAQQQAAEQAIAQDPLVKRIVEQFEGRVVEESIRPADTGRR